MNKLLFLLPVCLCIACETTIYPELDQAEKILVIDAWINRKMERQEIRISYSQPYFENSIPEWVNDAFVRVVDQNTGEVFDFTNGTDYYYWDPMDTPFGTVGHEYRLEIILGNETFYACSTLGRVPHIDSVFFQYNEADMLIKEDYFTAEFMSTDPLGTGDTYWVKAWKNGIYLGKPSELNMVYDAGFSSGQSVDGKVFLIPIRKDFINPWDLVPDKQSEYLPPYLPGDSVYVEIHSINHLAFDYLWGVYFQINRPGGFAELFSMPLVNAITNIKSTNSASQINVAGFFNAAAVSSGGRKLTQEMADHLRKSFYRQ